MWQNMALFSLYIYPSLYPFLPSFKNMSECFRVLQAFSSAYRNEPKYVIHKFKGRQTWKYHKFKNSYVDKFKRENKCRDCTFLHSFLTTLWASQAQWLNLPYKCRSVGWKQNSQSPRSSWIFSIPYCTHHHMPQTHSC